MYFIELIIKKLTQKKETPQYTPLSDDELQEYESCEHIFMPIDSTSETLSCTLCGLVVKKSELRNKNFFIND